LDNKVLDIVDARCNHEGVNYKSSKNVQLLFNKTK